MNRIFFFIIIFFVLVSIAQAATISNTFLLLDVDDGTGRISLSTAEGMAEVKGDERANLLFYDKPPSSYTVVYVNSDAIIFGSERGGFSKNPISLGNTIEAAWENDLVRVEQYIRFVKRKDSGNEDGVLVTYRVQNKTKHNLSVGIRILFDTYLGESSLYHFELEGNKKLRYEAEFLGEEIPQYWESKGGAKSPFSCLRGVVQGNMVTKPDRLLFANYKSLGENLVRYKVLKKKRFDNPPYSKNDSAVALYFNQKELSPGTKREYSTILTLCGEGVFGEEGEEVVRVEERVVTTKPTEEKARLEEVPILKEEVNTDLILEELKKVEKIRNNLKDINQLVDELNLLLLRESKTISEEEIIRLRKALSEYGKID